MKIRGDDLDRLYGLEPIFEPGQEAGSQALERFIDIACPYCAEQISVRVDLSAGPQNYVEDCQVCCQPIALSVPLPEDDQSLAVVAERVG